MPLRPPVLSELDPVLEGEGSVDPLGLQAAYERLADRILPAVTVRMTRPRFLTAIAVGAGVCEPWEEDDLAADGVTPAWLVFEWYVIESFVRSANAATERERIAGILKARRAIREHGHLSAPLYLKTPKVFGFSGIFRRLAVAAGVITEDFRLDNAGHDLLRAWEADRYLEGFFASKSGPGATLRARLETAVRHGMARGTTTSQPQIFWDELAAHLEPGQAGVAEKQALYDIVRLGSRRDRSTQEVVQQIEARGAPLAWIDEAPFLRSVTSNVSDELRSALAAIDAYECLCRPVTDAFNMIRHLSAVSGHAPVGPQEFGRQDRTPLLVEKVREGARRASESQPLLDWEPRIKILINQFCDVTTGDDLFDCVVRRHETAQREKPPHGKRSWLERSRGAGVVVRPAYGLATLPEASSPYVHEYRTPTVSRFLGDLGRFS